MHTISREELKRRLDAGEKLTLVEALPPRYYEAGHLPGAINIPHDRVAELAGEQLADRNATIVVYCASAACQNSRIAAHALRSAGYGNVFTYVGGKADWEGAGYRLEPAQAKAA